MGIGWDGFNLKENEMGYEIKLYYGEKTGQKRNEKDNAQYFQVVGMVDVCKPGYDSKLFALNKNAPKTPEVFFYDSDGNTEVITDRYDDALRVRPVADVLKALRADNKREPYRRFSIAIAALQAAQKDFKDLQVVFFGY